MVAPAPFSASEEQTMVGVGCSLMIFLRKVRPSMRGISMSITSTSGHWTLHLVQRIDRIGRHADDFDVGLALQGLAIDLAHHGRVVDDHYLDLVGHDLPMIFISSYPEVPSVVRAMRGGALDFFQKPFAPQQVLDRIQDGLRIDKARSHRQARSRAIGERMALLTPREKEVLQGVFEGKLTKTIAHDLGISQRTAETYRHLMMEKLQAGSVAELVRLTIEFLPAHDSP
jgi:FixJ family two-component response regulator